MHHKPRDGLARFGCVPQQRPPPRPDVFPFLRHFFLTSPELCPNMLASSMEAAFGAMEMPGKTG